MAALVNAGQWSVREQAFGLDFQSISLIWILLECTTLLLACGHWGTEWPLYLFRERATVRQQGLSKLPLTQNLLLWSTSAPCQFTAGIQMLLSLLCKKQHLFRGQNWGRIKNQSECWMFQESHCGCCGGGSRNSLILPLGILRPSPF